MDVILSEPDSKLKKKIIDKLNFDLSEYRYDSRIRDNPINLLIVIDLNLSKFEEDILTQMRKSTNCIGIWSKDISTSYLPKKINDLLDSLVCEDNISIIPTIINEPNKNIFQLPDCSELEIEVISRVNCRTGKKI